MRLNFRPLCALAILCFAASFARAAEFAASNYGAKGDGVTLDAASTTWLLCTCLSGLLQRGVKNHEQ